MFPVSDFNFVVAGIATFAATVGYACSRKLTSSQPSSDAGEEATRESVSPSSKSQEQNPVMPSSSGTSILQTLMNAAPAAYTITRRGSMKRKAPHDGFDEDDKRKLEYPHNLANLYPNKRSRTPSTESECSEVTPPSFTPAATLASITSQIVDHDMDIPLVNDEPQPVVDTPATEPPETPSPVIQFPPTPRAPSPVLATETVPTREASPRFMYPSSPRLLPSVMALPPALEVKETTTVVESTPVEPVTEIVLPEPEPELEYVDDIIIPEAPQEEEEEETGFVLKPARFIFSAPPSQTMAPPPTRFVFPEAVKEETKAEAPPAKFFFAVPQTPKSMTSFKAFSTPNKGFSAFASSSSSSPFTSSPFNTSTTTKVHETATTKSIWTVDVGLASQKKESESSAVDSFAALFDQADALGGTKLAKSILPTTYKHVTGEEDECIDAELKNVRLFVKRGNKAFSEGVAGNVKILTNVETFGQRVLFRREPLLKISMNVRISGAVRCTYSPDENIVRLLLKEAIDGTEKQEVVIYAIKPGRHCPKDDFKEFAQTLYQTLQSTSTLSTPSTPKLKPASLPSRIS